MKLDYQHMTIYFENQICCITLVFTMYKDRQRHPSDEVIQGQDYLTLKTKEGMYIQVNLK